MELIDSIAVSDVYEIDGEQQQDMGITYRFETWAISPAIIPKNQVKEKGQARRFPAYPLPSLLANKSNLAEAGFEPTTFGL